MNSQERDIIDGIFNRLQAAASQPRDPEAERHINEHIRQQPYAPYAMAQSLYVQEQAFNNLNTEVEALRAEVQRLQSQPQKSGGFLSGLFGGGAPAPQQRGSFSQGAGGPGMNGGAVPGYPPRQPMAPQPAAGPWGQPQAAAAAAPRAGMGFMGTAMATAAGVAGGMVLGNALKNAFNGDSSAAGESASQASAAGQFGNDSMSDQVTHQNYADNSQYSDEQYDAGYDDSSSFGGDGDYEV